MQLYQWPPTSGHTLQLSWKRAKAMEALNQSSISFQHTSRNINEEVLGLVFFIQFPVIVESGPHPGHENCSVCLSALQLIVALQIDLQIDFQSYEISLCHAMRTVLLRHFGVGLH